MLGIAGSLPERRVAGARRRVRLLLRKMLCSVISLSLVMGVLPAVALASTNQVGKQLLTMLKKYDSNGYYIVSAQSKAGDDISVWCSGMDPYSDLDTTVHEECHAWSHVAYVSADRIYIGGKKSVKVPKTKVFQSKKMAKSVPKRLRSERYYTYVAKPVAYLDSNVNGPYGMLNEFMAYCWGFNADVCLYKYASSLPCTDDTWLEYYGSSVSVPLAYVEFRYFIEQYLLYAQKHDKKVYQGIVSNKSFRKAIKAIDKKYAKLIKTYDARIPKVARKLRAAGYDVSFEDDCLFVGKSGSSTGRSLMIAQYNLFAKELRKSKYRSIEKKLGLSRPTVRKVSV